MLLTGVIYDVIKPESCIHCICVYNTIILISDYYNGNLVFSMNLQSLAKQYSSLRSVVFLKHLLSKHYTVQHYSYCNMFVTESFNERLIVHFEILTHQHKIAFVY